VLLKAPDLFPLQKRCFDQFSELPMGKEGNTSIAIRILPPEETFIVAGLMLL